MLARGCLDKTVTSPKDKPEVQLILFPLKPTHNKFLLNWIYLNKGLIGNKLMKGLWVQACRDQAWLKGKTCNSAAHRCRLLGSRGLPGRAVRTQVWGTGGGSGSPTPSAVKLPVGFGRFK